jgi:ankyrin repeat protein
MRDENKSAGIGGGAASTYEGDGSSDRSLLAAIARRDAETVLRLLEMGIRPRSANRTGAAGHLEAAARENASVDILALLLPRCDPRAVNELGQNALMVAAECGADSCVRLLLPLCDPQAVDHAGRDALMLAAEGGSARCVELLLPVSNPRALSHWGRSALSVAAAFGHSACVDLLLPVSEPGLADRDGRTALMLALWSESLGCVQLLLPASSAAHRDKDGATPLHFAANRGRMDFIALLAPISDADAADDRGFTPLMEAAARGGSLGRRAIETLIEKSDLELRNADGLCADELSGATEEVRGLIRRERQRRAAAAERAGLSQALGDAPSTARGPRSL